MDFGDIFFHRERGYLQNRLQPRVRQSMETWIMGLSAECVLSDEQAADGRTAINYQRCVNG